MTTDQGPGERRLPTSEAVETVEDYVIDRAVAAYRLAEVGTEAHRIAAALQTAVGDLALSLQFDLTGHQEARGADKDVLAARITVGWNRLVGIADCWRGEPGFPDGLVERIPDGSLRDDPEFMAAARAHQLSAEQEAVLDSLFYLDGQADPTAQARL